MVGHRDFYASDAAGAKFGASSDRAHVNFVCGHCGTATSGVVLAFPKAEGDQRTWMACTACGEPTVLDSRDRQHPLMLPGAAVRGLPDDVEAAWDEARAALGAGAFTASELMCRKILMHVAVDLAGAKAGATFVSYIESLESAGYVTPPMKPWVTQIKDHGNNATHELPQVDRRRAEGTLAFTEQLLRLSYEMVLMSAEFAGDGD